MGVTHPQVPGLELWGAISLLATPTQRFEASSHIAPSTPWSTPLPGQGDVWSPCAPSVPGHPCLQPPSRAPARTRWTSSHCRRPTVLLKGSAAPRRLSPPLLVRTSTLHLQSELPQKKQSGGRLPWWLSGKESACRCSRHGFNPRSGRFPRAAELLSPCITTTEPAL